MTLAASGQLLLSQAALDIIVQGQDGPCWLVLRNVLYKGHFLTPTGVQWFFFFFFFFSSQPGSAERICCFLAAAETWQHVADLAQAWPHCRPFHCMHVSKSQS